MKMKMKVRPALVALLTLVVFALSVSVAFVLTTASALSTETQDGKFIIKCGFSHRKQVDPIVAPGGPSGHMHDFFGNRSTDSSSTYESMIPAGTTCALTGDRAGYWIPTLRDPSGRDVSAKTMFAYYRNKPVGYSMTRPFPPDFRFISGGVGTYPGHTFWNCHGDVGTNVAYSSPPFCGTSDLKMNLFFPNCWNGVNTDSADHRSHVVYPVGNKCPQSHPVKLPDVRFFVHYPRGSGGPGWKLSDGTTVPHADFWNTWQQPALEDLVRRCLNAGVQCGQVK